MRIVVDGIIYGKNSEGGIARYWTEVMRILPGLGGSLCLDVVVPPGANCPADVPCRTSGRLSTLLTAARADIFHTTYYTRWLRVKCPSVVTAYDYIDASFQLLQPNGPGFVERQMESIRRASAVITISHASRDLTVELAGVDPARVFVAYPGVASSFSMPLPREEEIREFRQKYTGGAPYLVHVGKRTNYKNFRTILRAFCRAAPSMDRHLLVLGGGHSFADDELELVVSARLHDRVHFYRRADDAMLRLAYAGADAMVHASLMEGFGISVIEALACGTGLILSDIQAYREIAGAHAIFVEAVDVDAWAQAMREEARVSPSWREEILRQYTWEAAARTHVKAYESVI